MSFSSYKKHISHKVGRESFLQHMVFCEAGDVFVLRFVVKGVFGGLQDLFFRTVCFITVVASGAWSSEDIVRRFVIRKKPLFFLDRTCEQGSCDISVREKFLAEFLSRGDMKSP